MFFPYSVDVPMERRPIANWLLIAATVIGSIFFFGSEDFDHVFVLYRGEDFRIIQLLGSLIGHAGWAHLLGNMAFLFVFGNAINAKLGHVLYLLVYAAIGIVEGLVWLVVGNSEATLGASGAIMGIIGAFLVMYPRNDVSVYFWFTLAWKGTFEISAYWVVLTYVAFDIWGLVSSGDSAVNYVAHIVGAITGFGIMSGLLATKIITSDSDEMTLFEVLKDNSASKKAAAGRRARRGGKKNSDDSEDWTRFPAPSDAPRSSPPASRQGGSKPGRN
jgi:membrane associated rhomboid family serine protease